MAVAWSWAFDTPFKWTKQIASHFGGTRQGLAISWPARIKDVGGVRHQFHHIIDIVPTILEATGVKAPQVVDGIKQKPIEGVSMMYTFDKANAVVASTRKTQYFEMISNRGIYHDGWYANTTPPHGPWILNAPLPAPTDYKWELYNLTEDYSQAFWAMLIYNVLIALYLAYLGTAGHLDGLLLWPAVALHAVVSLLLVWTRRDEWRNRSII